MANNERHDQLSSNPDEHRGNSITPVILSKKSNNYLGTKNNNHTRKKLSKNSFTGAQKQMKQKESQLSSISVS